MLEDGARLLEAKDYLTALEVYRRADALAKSPATMLGMGRANEAMGRLIDARAAYESAAGLEVQASEPEAHAAARREAGERLAAISPKIPSLVVKVSGVPAGSAPPSVMIDGLELASPLEGRKVDPGKRAIEVRLTGFRTATSEVDVSPGERRVVEVALTPERDADTVKADLAAAVASASYHDATDRSAAFVRVGIGVLAVGALVGSAFGLLSLSRASAAEDHCDGAGRCSPDARSDIDTSITYANVSNVSFVVAGAGAGLVLYGLFTRPAPRTGQGVTVRPILGAGAAGLSGSF